MFNVIRTAITAILLVAFNILTLPLVGICYVVRIFNKKIPGAIAQWCIRFQSKLILFMSACDIDVRGTENIPEGTVLFTSNHRSYTDIVMAYAYTYKRLSFVGKKFVFETPVLNYWMRLSDGIMIDVGDIRSEVKAITSAIEHINDNISIWICPEGTREHSEKHTDMLPFKHGSYKIALKTNCPVVPVAIYGTKEMFEDQIPILKKGRLAIHYLEPVYPDSLTIEEQKNMASDIQERIRKTLAEIDNQQ